MQRISEVVSKCALREKETDGTACFPAIPPRWISRRFPFFVFCRNSGRCRFEFLPQQQKNRFQDKSPRSSSAFVIFVRNVSNSAKVIPFVNGIAFSTIAPF